MYVDHYVGPRGSKISPFSSRFILGPQFMRDATGEGESGRSDASGEGKEKKIGGFQPTMMGRKSAPSSGSPEGHSNFFCHYSEVHRALVRSGYLKVGGVPEKVGNLRSSQIETGEGKKEENWLLWVWGVAAVSESVAAADFFLKKRLPEVKDAAIKVRYVKGPPRNEWHLPNKIKMRNRNFGCCAAFLAALEK